MNTSNILAFLEKALGIFNAVKASGLIPSGTNDVAVNYVGMAATLAADVAAVVNGANSPTPDLLARVTQLLTDLKVNGILQGRFMDTLDAEVAQFGTFAKAIQSTPVAQPGIGPREKLLGVEGAWVFIADTCAPEVKAPFGL